MSYELGAPLHEVPSSPVDSQHTSSAPTTTTTTASPAPAPSPLSSSTTAPPPPSPVRHKTERNEEGILLETAPPFPQPSARDTTGSPSKPVASSAASPQARTSTATTSHSANSNGSGQTDQPPNSYVQKYLEPQLHLDQHLPRADGSTSATAERQEQKDPHPTAHAPSEESSAAPPPSAIPADAHPAPREASDKELPPPPPAYETEGTHESEGQPPAHTEIPAVNPRFVKPVEGEEHGAEVEKIKAERREMKGMEPKGTVVVGLEDDVLWAMLRRFDKQVTHTLSPPHDLPYGESDLRRSPLPTVPFNTDTIRSNIERCYATAGIGGIRFAREMQRLMSWSAEDRHRTAGFCAAYFTAWIFHQCTPLVIALIMVLIVSPRSRQILFPIIPPPPGVPPSATDPTNRKGDESMVDVVHPQKHRSKSEQVEEQSYEFVKGVEKFGLRVLMGGRSKPSDVQLALAEEEKAKESGEIPTTVTGKPALPRDRQPAHGAKGDETGQGARNKVLAEGGSLEEGNEKEGMDAKEKRDAMIGLYAKMMQDGFGDFADFVERSKNALSPPPKNVYPHNAARLKLALGIFLPILVITAVVPARIFSHAISFSIGFGFFGQPVLIRMATTFVKFVPDWQEKLDLRNSIFSEVPTDVQLAIHVLRQRELAFNPIPRPPVTPTAQNARAQLNDTSLINESSSENTTSSVGDGQETHLVGDGEHDDGTSPTKEKMMNKLASFGKKVSKKAATFRDKGKVEILPPGLHNEKVSKKTKLGRFLLNRTVLKDEGSIWSYPCELAKTTGDLIIEHDDDEPISSAILLFVPKSSDDPTETIPLSHIVELKKGGVGLPRNVLGWAAGVELGGTGLEIRVKDPGTITRGYESHPGTWVTNVFFDDENSEAEQQGKVLQFTRLGRRDELFVRLLAMSGNEWETL